MSAITLPIAGQSVAGAARTLGIGRRTIFRWLNHPDVRAEIDRRLAELSRGLPAAPRPSQPRRPRASAHRVGPQTDDDDSVDPRQLRADMEFVNAIAAEALGAKWRGTARYGTVRTQICKTNPPKGDDPLK
jgi:hypothetical protein